MAASIREGTFVCKQPPTRNDIILIAYNIFLLVLLDQSGLHTMSNSKMWLNWHILIRQKSNLIFFRIQHGHFIRKKKIKITLFFGLKWASCISFSDCSTYTVPNQIYSIHWTAPQSQCPCILAYVKPKSGTKLLIRQLDASRKTTDRTQFIITWQNHFSVCNERNKLN